MAEPRHDNMDKRRGTRMDYKNVLDSSGSDGGLDEGARSIPDSPTRTTRPCLGMSEIFMPDELPEDEHPINWKFMKPLVVDVCSGCCEGPCADPDPLVALGPCALGAMNRKETFGFWGGLHWTEIKQKKRKAYNAEHKVRHETERRELEARNAAAASLEFLGGLSQVV